MDIGDCPSNSRVCKFHHCSDIIFGPNFDNDKDDVKFILHCNKHDKPIEDKKIGKECFPIRVLGCTERYMQPMITDADRAWTKNMCANMGIDHKALMASARKQVAREKATKL